MVGVPGSNPREGIYLFEDGRLSVTRIDGYIVTINTHETREEDGLNLGASSVPSEARWRGGGTKIGPAPTQ